MSPPHGHFTSCESQAQEGGEGEMRPPTAQKTSDLAQTSVDERPTVANQRSVRGYWPGGTVEVTTQHPEPYENEYDGGEP